MSFGSTTKIVPTTQTSQQQISLPGWMQEAGEKGVGQATKIVDTPFQKYGDPLVAGLSGNQQSAINLAGSGNPASGSMGVATGALGNIAATAGRAGTAGAGARSQAGALYDTAAGQTAPNAGADNMQALQRLLRGGDRIAANSVNAGQGSLQAARQTLAPAGDLATSSMGAGRGAMGAAADNINDASDLARGTRDMGAGEYGTTSALGGVGGMEALNNIVTGKSDANRQSGLARTAGRMATGSTNAGQGDLDAARAYTTGSAAKIGADDINGYFNPYVSDVLDRSAQKLQTQGGEQAAELRRTAGSRGAFGGDRQTLMETANDRNTKGALGDLYTKGYADAYDRATGLATDYTNRQGRAAELSQGTAGLADQFANTSLGRIVNAGTAAGDASRTQSGQADASQGRLATAAGVTEKAGRLGSDLATESQGRSLAAGDADMKHAGLDSDLSTAALERLKTAGNAYTDLSGAESARSSESLDRMLAAGDANKSAAGAESALADSAQKRTLDAGNAKALQGQGELAAQGQEFAQLRETLSAALETSKSQYEQRQADIQNLVATGQMEQTQAQNELDVAYQQFLREQDDAANKLNTFISVLSGTPYGTTTNSTTKGQTVVQGASPFSQVAGALIGGAGLAMGSDKTKKTNIKKLSREDQEDVLAKLRRIDVSTYNYKSKAGKSIGDDGRMRIGPMSQDWGNEFSDDPDMTVIPMPQMLGKMLTAIKALDARTAGLS